MDFIAKQRASKEKYKLFGTSLTYHVQLFFDKSTMHGMRYIKEQGRPLYEKLMWFCFTAIGAVVTAIIIVSLWEKYQTNPTITGLDADFHSWDVPFPSVALCLINPVNDSLVKALVQEKNPADVAFVRDFYRNVANLSLHKLGTLYSFYDVPGKQLASDQSLLEIQKQSAIQCPKVLEWCLLSTTEHDCCSMFQLMPTEVGPCFVYNSRHVVAQNGSTVPDVHFMSEMDERYSLVFRVTQWVMDTTMRMRIYILSNDELPTVDVNPQYEWDYRVARIIFSAKSTYTTDGAHELSARQRRCVFDDEYQLLTDHVYTYSTCMSECRMRQALAICGCVPFFYRAVDGYKFCAVNEMKCLAENADKLERKMKANCHCYIGCFNTVYDVERLLKVTSFQDFSEKNKFKIMDLSFVSWPLVRYKREVLFGWDDLLVSFGGIAGLFLGCSLLSFVETLYYFTMRAACMVDKDKEDLRQLQLEYTTMFRPPLDLSLMPYWVNQEAASIAKVHVVGVAMRSPRATLPIDSYQYLP